ncbi:alanine aminotransferase 2-like [Hyperolius riggenbachi]|uniref:alanine aminotransferase 2-like n=1 Tax=Hyperolius riggenbachi TaxID=752182 RepID=UPI0035A30CB5
MATRKRLLNLDTMNQAVLDVEDPLGSVIAREVEMQQEINQGIKKPFDKVACCHLGDLQLMGYPPCTFLRQVAALCTYPELLDSDRFPQDAKQRARDIIKQLANGSVGSYNMTHINYEVNQKVAKFIERRDGGIPSNPRDILVSDGATQAILAVLAMAVNNEGTLRTGIMVSVPYHPLYADTIRLNEAVKVEYLLDEEHGWAVNVDNIRESLYAARKHCDPRVLCVINPGNPTGHVLSRDSMEEIIRLAAQEKLLLFADEVYQDNVFAPGAIFHSFKKVLFEMGPEYSERVQLVSVNSISKGISGECGLRSGYVEFVNVDPEVFGYLYILKSYELPNGVGVVAMESLLEPLQPGDPSYETFQAERRTLLNNLAKNARLAEEILNRAPGIHCNPIQGAMYAYPRIHIPDTAITLAQDQGVAPDALFCHLLLEDTGIILLDGTSFGQAAGTYHVRLSLIHPPQELKSTLQKIVEFHARFVQEYS